MEPSLFLTRPARRRGSRGIARLMLVLGCLGLWSSCSDAITQLLSARRVTADLRVKFNQATEATHRAVMAPTDEASIAFAREAEQAKLEVRKDTEALMPLLRDLRSDEAVRMLEDFKKRFLTYEELDRTILDLAVQNTNLKAQKLAFGDAAQSADALQRALEAVARNAAPKNRCRIESLTARANLAVRTIQALQAPHIAEAQDAVMSNLEKQMEDRFGEARGALDEVAALSEPTVQADLTAGTEALTRFRKVHEQIVPLSRTNSNVRSLELVLGKGRTATAACDSGLAALQEALAREGFPATR